MLTNSSANDVRSAIVDFESRTERATERGESLENGHSSIAYGRRHGFVVKQDRNELDSGHASFVERKHRHHRTVVPTEEFEIAEEIAQVIKDRAIAVHFNCPIDVRMVADHGVKTRVNRRVRHGDMFRRNSRLMIAAPVDCQ